MLGLPDETSNTLRKAGNLTGRPNGVKNFRGEFAKVLPGKAWRREGVGGPRPAEGLWSGSSPVTGGFA